MSRIHLRSNTLVLWLSLSAAAAASALGVGCSSSSKEVWVADEAGGTSTAGKGDGKAGASASGGEQPGGDAGDDGVGGSTEAGGTGGREEPVRAGSGGDEPVGRGGGGEAPVDENAAAIARAEAYIDALPLDRRCTKCHQPSFSGLKGSHWPNITQDEETGIGTWTVAEIKKAITEGIGKGNVTLCNEMERYQMTPQELDDIIALLYSKAIVTKTGIMACVNP